MKATEFKESAQDVLFILKIDMGSGRHSFINFGQTDTPEAIALEFCKSHGLSIKTYDFLVATLQQKRTQVVGGATSPGPSPKRLTGDFGFGGPVETVEYPVAGTKIDIRQPGEKPQQKSSNRAASGNKLAWTTGTSSSERNLTTKWRSPQTSSNNRPIESDTKLLEDKISEYYEIKPKGTPSSSDVYERLYFNAKNKQIIDPLMESRSAMSVLPRSKSSDSHCRSASGTIASNRLYYCGLKNKSIRE
jgi:hypothetical protein